ncbi:hypothetical protein B0H12DRAFT_758972 [Mycena haematopus]|nr:hypothetical protein B0H12DRAFT_758972 [Mycena haematopus]
MTQFYPPPNTRAFAASFAAFPNSTRPPQRTMQQQPAQFYPQDQFVPQLASPVQAPYDPRTSFDFKGYPPLALDYHQQQQQQQRAMHSQTPYGPHVPIGAINGSMASMGAMQEDISTIFVVGFPEDMQEREFQNMFTFSPGFEAATLKIPNKEYTAYGGIGALSPQPQPQLPQSHTNSNAANQQQAQARGMYTPGAGPNDPYNLVTVNQGGVLVDVAGREGGIASWPAPPPSNASNAGSGDESAQAQQQQQQFAPGGMNNNLNNAGTPILPPRKQIIGFAKFRTREEALGARDVLQGRRVDIDKGAVLKAEMAKKNLHTKRGVGPVGGGVVGANINGGVNGGVNMNPNVNMNGAVGGGGMMNGMSLNEMYAEALSPREREAGALVAMGLPVPPGSALPHATPNNMNGHPHSHHHHRAAGAAPAASARGHTAGAADGEGEGA